MSHAKREREISQHGRDERGEVEEASEEVKQTAHQETPGGGEQGLGRGHDLLTESSVNQRDMPVM